jgi:hypothetical protein
MSEDSVSTKLQELFELFKAGALSKDEYDQLKSELLNGVNIPSFDKTLPTTDQPLPRKDGFGDSKERVIIPQVEVGSNQINIPKAEVDSQQKTSNNKLRNAIIAILVLGLVVAVIIIISINYNNKQDSTSIISETNNIVNEKITEVTTAPAQNIIVCSAKEQKIEGSEDPRTIKTCTWGNFKSISTGEADFKGRYSYSSKLFKLTNNTYVAIKNSQLFNENKTELLEILNQRIKKSFDEYSNDPEFKDCFDGISAPHFSIDDLGIYFDDSGINFDVSFGLSGACMSVDGITISFKLDEIESYINR